MPDMSMTIRTETIIPVRYGVRFRRVDYARGQARIGRIVRRFIRRWADREGLYAGDPSARVTRDYATGETFLSVECWAVPRHPHLQPTRIELHLAAASYNGKPLAVLLD